MGSWDVYCAFCGSALCGAHVAEKPRSARFRRRRQREQRDAATANEEGSQSDAENESGDQEESEGEDDDDDDDDDDDCSIGSCDEEHSYDPAILDEKDLEWTKSVYILGFNPYASSIRKTFIAGPGHYWDYGSVEIDAGQPDPNQPDDGNFTCYYSIESGELPVFPFHWCCYELLLRTLTGTTDADKLDRDLLYNIMHELAPDYAKALELDYGDPCPDQDQFWCSNAGEEVLVVQPSLNPEITSLLRSAIAEDTFKKTDSADMSLNLESRISSDPFSKLPYDILYKVCASLPFGSISDLSIASWLVNVTLRSTDGLWKHLLRNSMPWFFELHDLLDDEKLMENRDFRKLFLWIEKMTRPRLWMDGPFMGVANRRRIWGVCEQLAERYHARLEQRNNEDELDETAKLIMKHSDNPHMPLVIYPPQTVSVETTSTQWVRSWTELDSPVAIFETFWDTRGSLTGLAMSFLGNRRLFGHDDTVNGVTRSVLPIGEPSQLNGFILHLRQVDEETSIKGITVVHNYFSSDLGMPDPAFSQRPLLINKGKKLVGVVGQIANGKICRLGLIQCPRPPRDVLVFLDLPSPESDIPEQQKLLWKSDLGHIFKNGHERIWNHERLRVIPSADTGSHLRDIPDDLLPYEALLWATKSKEMRNVKCLSGYVNVGGTVSIMSQIDERKWVTRDYHDICGARVEFVPEYDQPKRFVGKDREIDGDWKEENMAHFPIDGPGGEVVTRVDVSGGGLRKGLKLFTNRGRETHWGEKDAVNWETLEAPQGESIVGLVMAFGVMSGPVSEETGKRHQTAMSYAAIMTLPRDAQWMDPA